MRDAKNGKWVVVKVGRGGTEVHAKDCSKNEGRAGFFSHRTECGQQRSSRSALALLRDSVAPADLDRLVTCAKCRASLGLSLSVTA